MGPKIVNGESAPVRSNGTEYYESVIRMNGAELPLKDIRVGGRQRIKGPGQRAEDTPAIQASRDAYSESGRWTGFRVLQEGGESQRVSFHPVRKSAHGLLAAFAPFAGGSP